MKPEQIQPGALVYHLLTGRLYQLGKPIKEAPPSVWWTRHEIGRRGERTESLVIKQESLTLDHFALWCTRCDGTGRVDASNPAWGQTVCPDCDGEGLIR